MAGMWIADKHFMRYAGAMSAYDMFKQQRIARAQAVAPPAEKPLDSPDRPSNITKAISTGDLSLIPAGDQPNNILQGLSTFKPPEAAPTPTAQDNPSLPSAILASQGGSPAPQPPESTSGGIISETA